MHSKVYNKILLIASIIILIVTYFPILYLIPISFSEIPYLGVPIGFTTEWYEDLINDELMWKSLKTSLIVGFSTVGIVTPLSLAVGHAFQRIRRKAAFLSIILLPLFTPGIVLGATLAIFFQMLGMIPSFWAVLIVHIIWSLPFAFLIMVVTLSRFNWTLLEAAQNLGASTFRAFLDVELPLIKPGIIGAALFSFLLSFNEFIRTYLVRGTTTTLSLYIWAMMTTHASVVPRVYALSSIIFIFVLALLILALSIGTRRGLLKLF